MSSDEKPGISVCRELCACLGARLLLNRGVVAHSGLYLLSGRHSQTVPFPASRAQFSRSLFGIEPLLGDLALLSESPN